MTVGDNLDLDMARVRQELLHVDRRIAEGAARLLARQREGVEQARLRVHDAHAAAAAAARRLRMTG